MAGRRKVRAVEWIAGIAPMAAYVTGEGEPHRPEMLLWVSAEGVVLGCDVGRPGTMVKRAAEQLRATTKRPLAGAAHAPSRVRVASLELAAALEGALAGVEIVLGPTPELDAVLEAMGAALAQGGGGATSYMTGTVGKTEIAAFFRALAAFHRAAPWTAVPSDEALIVDIGALGVKRAALTVIGQGGESFGFAKFDDFAAFEDFIEAASEVDETRSGMPGHFAVNLLPLAELPDGLAAEVSRFGWEIAGPDAVPWPVVLDDDLVPRPPTAAELLIAEAIALAVAELVRTTRDLGKRWWSDAPFERTLTVDTHRGPIAVTLGVPRDDLEESTFGVVAELAALEESGEELDLDEVDELSERLATEFEGSREANPLPEVTWCSAVMDLAAAHLDITIASLRPADLETVLYELFPRNVSVEPSAARDIVVELRAFYAFLHRAHGHSLAAGCLRVLGPDTENRLEAALADASQFDTAKALLAEGRARGFDMSSKEGIEAWMRAIQGKPLPASIRLPGDPVRASPARPAAGKKKRNKAARKARKKNR